MIAEVIPGFYDAGGRRIFQPSKKRHGAHWRVPMGSFLSQPVKFVCQDIDEMRAFLSTCAYISDREQFGVEDHWAAPEQFEQTRRGDCDDFALWTWRQLLGMGYNPRFVVGRAGRYGGGHAWVTFQAGDKTFIVEPLLARAGATFPRLDTLRYKPSISVEVAESQVRYFEHLKRKAQPTLRDVAKLIPAWVFFRLRTFPRWVFWGLYTLLRRALLYS